MRRIFNEKLPPLEIILFFSLVLGLFMQRFYIDSIFAIKGYIIITVITIALLLKKIYKSKFEFMLYEKLFLLFSLYAIVRTFFSYDFDAGLRFILGYIFIILFYVVTRYLATFITEEVFEVIIFIVSLIFLSLSLFLFYFYNAYELDRGMYRLIGTIIDPNIYCLYAIIPFAYFIKNLNKPWWYIIGFLTLFSVFLTSSRGGAVGLLIFIAAYMFYYRSKIKPIHIIIILIGSLGLHFLLINTISIYVEFINRFFDLFREELNVDAGSGRIGIWLNGIELFKDNVLFGIGLNNFRTLNYLNFNNLHYAHNTFLEILIETGVIGFVIYGSALFLFIKTKTNENSSLIIIKAILISFLVQSVFLSNSLQEIMFFMLAMYTSFYTRGYNYE